MGKRNSYKKWRIALDVGLQSGEILPAWNPGDQVEVIGTGVRGKVVRCTTLDWTRWELVLPSGKSVETHATNLRVAA